MFYYMNLDVDHIVLIMMSNLQVILFWFYNLKHVNCNVTLN